jgi:hypothetical protein
VGGLAAKDEPTHRAQATIDLGAIRRTVFRATPNRAATSVTVSPSARTARTASYLCSATLLSLTQGVSPINGNSCNPSTETLSGISRRPNVTYQPE